MDKIVEKTYDKIAQEYYDRRIKNNPKGWFYNELLEMPTTLNILGNIKGKRIFDLGCGPGIYAKLLNKKGAKVKGMDISSKEIEIARKTNPEIEFKVGNAEKLPYKNGEFDIVLAALVLEHFDNWNKVLKEIFRVLKSKGIFVFSTGNPVGSCVKLKNGKVKLTREYFKEGRAKSKWWGGVYMPWYHKTYGTIVKLLVKNGFELADYEDAKPLKKSQKLFPGDYSNAMTFPYFCTWKWRKR